MSGAHVAVSARRNVQSDFRDLQSLWLRGWQTQAKAVEVEEGAKEGGGPASLFPPEVAVRGLSERDGSRDDFSPLREFMGTMFKLRQLSVIFKVDAKFQNTFDVDDVLRWVFKDIF